MIVVSTRRIVCEDLTEVPIRLFAEIFPDETTEARDRMVITAWLDALVEATVQALPEHFAKVHYT